MRRHLGMSWGEWRALPWYEQRALREGLLEEFQGVTQVPTSEIDDVLGNAGIQVN